MSNRRLPVAVLGATGTVGQKLIRFLSGHPWFEVAAVAASDGNVGKPYREAARWREMMPIPDSVANLELKSSKVPLDLPIAFSALDTESAKVIEPIWAQHGVLVVTNASPHRMVPDVPLVVPEVNASHLGLLERQRTNRGWKGGIVANPNCTTAGLVVALAPLHQAFGVDKLFVSTMQAISGAGWPGVASLDITGNVIPFIGGEEDKVESEPKKLLGRLGADRIDEADLTISAHTNRVSVVDGHTETLSIGFKQRVSIEQVRAALTGYPIDPTVRSLPSTPATLIEIDERPDRPQPRLDIDRGNGMTVTIGRIRPCSLLDVRMVLLSHNTVRGAAGAAIQNAELLVATGVVPR